MCGFCFTDADVEDEEETIIMQQVFEHSEGRTTHFLKFLFPSVVNSVTFMFTSDILGKETSL